MFFQHNLYVTLTFLQRKSNVSCLIRTRDELPLFTQNGPSIPISSTDQQVELGGHRYLAYRGDYITRLDGTTGLQ